MTITIDNQNVFSASSTLSITDANSNAVVSLEDHSTYTIFNVPASWRGSMGSGPVTGTSNYNNFGFKNGGLAYGQGPFTPTPTYIAVVPALNAEGGNANATSRQVVIEVNGNRLAPLGGGNSMQIVLQGRSLSGQPPFCRVTPNLYYISSSIVLRRIANAAGSDCLLVNTAFQYLGGGTGLESVSFSTVDPVAICYLPFNPGFSYVALINFQNYSPSRGMGRPGYIGVNQNNALLFGASDHRLKTDIEPMSGALDVIDRLRPVYYHVIDEEQDQQDSELVQGFIAHELQEVIPEAVSGQRDEVDRQGQPRYQMISLSPIIPWLTAAIQELIQEVEDFEQELDQYQGSQT